MRIKPLVAKPYGFNIPLVLLVLKYLMMLSMNLKPIETYSKILSFNLPMQIICYE